MKKLIDALIIIICLLMTSNALAKERLVFAVDLIRHGDRTPIHEIPKSPYLWHEGLGELTAEGMQQEFQLGTALRKKYIDQYQLLPAHYLAETMYVRSTDINRTLVSAQSLLLGLYPLGTGPRLVVMGKPALPAAYQPIPIHTVPTEQDRLLLAKSSKNIFFIIKYFIANYKNHQATPAALKDKMKYWSQVTGLPITNTRQLGSLGDILYVRELHHIPLPQGINQQEAAEIIALGKGAIVSAFKTQEITYPMGHEFLQTVANYMKQAAQAQSPLRYVLFSGHESSIMAVMTTLGMPLDEVPRYASDLNLALFEDNKKYYVKLNLNNKPVTIPACKSNSCSLAQFYALAHDF